MGLNQVGSKVNCSLISTRRHTARSQSLILLSLISLLVVGFLRDTNFFAVMEALSGPFHAKYGNIRLPGFLSSGDISLESAVRGVGQSLGK